MPTRPTAGPSCEHFHCTRSSSGLEIPWMPLIPLSKMSNRAIQVVVDMIHDLMANVMDHESRDKKGINHIKHGRLAVHKCCIDQ